VVKPLKYKKYSSVVVEVRISSPNEAGLSAKKYYSGICFYLNKSTYHCPAFHYIYIKGNPSSGHDLSF
jgi:hypothetical protein